MSQENVETLRRAQEAFNRRDLDGFLALMDPDVESIPYEVSIQGGEPYRGHDGVRRWWRETFEVLPDLTVETQEVRDLGETVFVRGRLRGHGAGSRVSFDRPLWQVVAFRDGRTVWWQAFGSKAEALEAVGLSE